MMTCIDLNHKNKSKNKATSNINIQQVLSSIVLDKVIIYLRGGPFLSDIGIVNFHPSKGTHKLHRGTKYILIVMFVSVQKNYLGFL